MVVDAYTSNPSLTGVLDGAGFQQLDVGATLNVNSNQQVGDYTGIYSVIVNYN